MEKEFSLADLPDPRESTPKTTTIAEEAHHMFLPVYHPPGGSAPSLLLDELILARNSGIPEGTVLALMTINRLDRIADALERIAGGTL